MCYLFFSPCACSVLASYPGPEKGPGISLVPRPEEGEEKKGPGFSRSRMRLIAVEFHRFRILLIYFRTLVTLESILNVTLSVDLL